MNRKGQALVEFVLNSALYKMIKEQNYINIREK